MKAMSSSRPRCVGDAAGCPMSDHCRRGIADAADPFRVEVIGTRSLYWDGRLLPIGVKTREEPLNTLSALSGTQDGPGSRSVEEEGQSKLGGIHEWVWASSRRRVPDSRNGRRRRRMR